MIGLWKICVSWLVWPDCDRSSLVGSYVGSRLPGEISGREHLRQKVRKLGKAVQDLMGGWGGGTYLPVVVNNLAEYVTVGYTPNPEIPTFGVRWDQALQEVWEGKPAQQALDEVVAEVNDHMKRAGYLTG